MNENWDALEAELRAIQPRPVSPDLEGRIAAEISRDSVSPARRRLLAATIAVAAVAASVLLVVWLWPGGRVAEIDPPVTLPSATLAAALDPALPSVWSFRRGVSKSEQELDVLLDRHSGRTPAPQPHFVQIRGFGASEMDRHDLLGEL